MATYRTKLVQIEAHRFDGDEGALVRWIESTRKPGRFRFDKGAVFIETLEGEMRGDVGDYIICGLRGEFYPCKPDVFHAKYELAAASAPTGAKEAGRTTQTCKLCDGFGWLIPERLEGGPYRCLCGQEQAEEIERLKAEIARLRAEAEYLRRSLADLRAAYELRCRADP